MSLRTALVTGAAGFLGRHIVRTLHDADYHVKAGIHHDRDRRIFADMQNVQPVVLDILVPGTLHPAMEGVDHVYHCAALLDAHAPRQQLMEVNVAGTRIVWECAAISGVRKALYCSSTAVYGLLARCDDGITERVKPRAVEPYGLSKLQGEAAALEVASGTNLHTTIIRPVAIFGPGEHTLFGKKLRAAAFSRLLIAGGFQKKKFSYVHVEDAAAAAFHLMERDRPSGQVYNVAANEPILYNEAFSAYIRVLQKYGWTYARPRFFSAVSKLLLNHERTYKHISMLLGDRFMFSIWHPGFDLIYSSEELLRTSFEFRWKDFETVFASCLEPERSEQVRASDRAD